MPKIQGGMAFPDQIRYYKAVHHARALAWCRDEEHKTWVAIEQSCTEIPLRCLPWLRLRTLGTLRYPAPPNRGNLKVEGHPKIKK